MLIDEVADPYTPATGSGIGAMLRGRSGAGGGTTAEPATPAVADFGGDSSYLDIPAFLRRQAD
jgi:cell division protein FtsZ